MTVRVLYLDHTAALGGGEIALLNLLRHLDRERVNPLVVLGSEGPLAEKLRPIADTYILPLSQRVSNAKKDSLGIGSIFRIREIISLVRYTLRLVQFIRSKNIDIVHTNSLKSDIIGGVASRLSSRPVVWHIRDRIENDYLPRIVVRIVRLLCRLIPRFVIANSFATLQTLHLQDLPSDDFILSSNPQSQRTAVIHEGTDLVPSSNLRGDTQGPLHVGLIGRISPWKGQHIFLQAAARVHRHFPEARFVIIGSALFGETSYEEDVRRLPGQLEIEDVVHFTGFCADAKTAIAGLDLVVHASTTGEPFGQVIIEGMAAGKPIVATDGGGVPEIVQNGETGILVPMGDVQAMADAICRLLADPSLARAMGHRGQQRVKDHFTMERTARKIEAVYELIMGGFQKSPS